MTAPGRNCLYRLAGLCPRDVFRTDPCPWRATRYFPSRGVFARGTHVGTVPLAREELNRKFIGVESGASRTSPGPLENLVYVVHDGVSAEELYQRWIRCILREVPLSPSWVRAAPAAALLTSVYDPRTRANGPRESPRLTRVHGPHGCSDSLHPHQLLGARPYQRGICL